MEEIYLSAPSAIEYVPVAAESTVGLEWATRVAFFDQGNDATNTPATARALAAGTSASQVIWEPNALTHTVASGLTNGVKDTYYGVKTADTGLTVVKSEQQTDAEGAAVNFGTISKITLDTDLTPFETIPGNIIFTVEPGINKIRVFIWIEGQDGDCENSISLGAGNISATIKFQKLN